jgi:PPE-repeat protein
MIEAAGAWQRLGTELQNTAGTFASAVSALTETWSGPSSLAMVQAVEPYLIWLRATARQAQQMAGSAQAAAAAFDSVRSAVVLPAQVSANRTRLAQLLATNTFGLNLPAIAQTEDQYQSMWANNSAAMSRYQVASAQATTLSQFSSPPSIANPAGAAAHASAVPAASSSATAAAAPAASSTLDSIISAIQSFNPQQGWFGLAATYGNQFIAGGIPINLLSYLAQLTAAQSLQTVGGDIGGGLTEGEAALGAAAGAGPGALGALGAAGLSAEPTAAIGVSVSLGKLSVPPAVVGLLSASQAPVQLASAVSPLPSDESGESGFPFLPPLPPPPTSAGSGWRKRTQQKYGEDEDSEYEEDEEYQESARGVTVPPPPDTAGSGWRKRANYDDIEFGAELTGTVMKKPPSAG